ncbi:MAG TPA: hypothetical protein VMW25_04660 [Clostridia bacterium]|nr:hypothetical protein [Clostridia bacterium]
MTLESQRIEEYLGEVLDSESVKLLKREGIVAKLPPPQRENGTKKEVVLYQLQSQKPQESPSEQKINLPERANTPRRKTPGLPGREAETPGDRRRVKNGRSLPESKCRGIYWIIEYLARAQGKKIGTKVPLNEITYQAAQKVLKRTLREDPESIKFARARLHADLRRFLKEWRKHEREKVYRLIALSEDRDVVNTKFKNKEWKKLYKKILLHFGDLSAREFIYKVEVVLPQEFY